MHTQKINYLHGDTHCEGFMAYGDEKKRPLVLVVHDWTGRNAHAENKAQLMTQWGYVGFAVDMYGEGRNGQNTDEKRSLMEPLMSDRNIIRQRLTAAITAAKKFPFVEAEKIAIIGFCFGGLCALELARSGDSILGAVSVHGLLHQDSKLQSKPISAKILALHGYDDPMVPPDQIINFAHEMTACKADWQCHLYGNTMHAFTNPLANDKNFGTVYNPVADKRAFDTISHFLKEIFE
jgi:dienelactone hydrolase